MFTSIRSRLIFYFTLSIFAAVLLSAILSISLVQTYTKRTTVERLRRQANSLAREIQKPNFDPSKISKTMGDFGETKVFLAGSYFLVGAYGESLPSNIGSSSIQLLEGSPNFIRWDTLSEGEIQIEERYLREIDVQVIMVAKPIFAQKRLLGAVVVAQPLSSYRKAWVPIAERLLLAGLFALVVSALIALYLAQRFSNPLKKITTASKRVAQGDYDQNIKVSSRDEIGELANTFNDMIQKVKQSQETKRNFLISISHELKTPLTSIQGFTEALLDRKVLPKQEREKSLEIIYKESRHLERLIRDLLDLAKLDAQQFSLNFQKVDLKNLLEECSQIYEKQALSKKIKFEAQIDPLPELKTDRNRLRQVIGNLLDNAFKFTPEGGKVTLKGAKKNSLVEIEVEDTGRGISKKEFPHLFEPFYFSKRASKAESEGTGLGLAITYQLIKALGGKISVSSNKDEGTTFRIELPL